MLFNLIYNREKEMWGKQKKGEPRGQVNLLGFVCRGASYSQTKKVGPLFDRGSY